MMPTILDASILVILDHPVEAIRIVLTAHAPSPTIDVPGVSPNCVEGIPLQVKLTGLTPDMIPTPANHKPAHAAAEQQQQIPQIAPFLDVDVGLPRRYTRFLS